MGLKTKLSIVVLFFSINALWAQEQITATVDFSNTKTVSPLIFGYNQDHESLTGDENWGSRRLGGNRLSTTNWETGASNCGHDCSTTDNDNRIPSLLGIPSADEDKTGETYRYFHQQNSDAGVTSILTLPIMGWVAADKDGANSTSPPNARWNELVYEKESAFSLTPDLNDGKVYLDESMNFIVDAFGQATSSTGIKYIALDNEPALWEATHPNVYTQAALIDDYIDKVAAAAKAIKAIDPTVKLIAGEFAGINIYDFNGGTDWSDKNANYTWFIDYFLDRMKQESDAAGVNLVDVISFHNYPQHKVDGNGDFSSSGTVVKGSTSTATAIRKTRMDFPRSMWDATYIEPSWLTASKLGGEPNMILKRLQTSIDTYYPGVKMMVGEWDYGHDEDISHGIAAADLLGVFVNEGLEIANRWDLNPFNVNNYSSPAFQLYRNYDGSSSTVGDLALPSTFTNADNGSVWVTKNSINNDLHIIVIAKAQTGNTEFTVDLSGGLGDYVIDGVFGFDGTSPSLTQPTNDASINGNNLTITLAPMTAYHVIVNQGPDFGCETLALGDDLTLCNPSIATINTEIVHANASFSWTHDGVDFMAGATHTTSTAGTYQVTVQIPNCIDVSDEIIISSDLLEIRSDTVCSAGDEAELMVLESESDYSWFNTLNDEMLLASSNTYTPVVNESSTYYVLDNNGIAFNLGKTSQDGTVFANTTTSNYSNANREMKMVIEQDLRVDTFSIYVNSTADVVINITDNSEYNKSWTFSGLAVGKHYLALNEVFTTGTYYIDLVGTTGGVDLQATNNGSNSLTNYLNFGMAPAWATVYYGFFYDWTISVGNTCDRTPVYAVLDPQNSNCTITGLNAVAETQLHIYPNPTSERLFINSLTNSSYVIFDVAGKVITKGLYDGEGIDLKNVSNGIYFIKIEDQVLKVVKN